MAKESDQSNKIGGKMTDDIPGMEVVNLNHRRRMGETGAVADGLQRQQVDKPSARDTY